MAVLISDYFHGDPRVLTAGNEAVGAWIRMLSWLSDWPEEPVISTAVWRMLGVRPRIVRALVDAQLLIEVDSGWFPLAEGDLWKLRRIISRPRIPQALRDLVMERDEFRCQRCGATENLSLDHIIPFSFGGPDTEENLRVLCRSCNSARGNRVEIEV